MARPRDSSTDGQSSSSPGGQGTLIACDRRLSPEELRWRCDPSELPFETTEEVEPLVGTIGQERAASALALGLEMEPAGFNLFVAGSSGTGRTSATRTFVEQIARTRPTPGDWCYVHNFKDPSCPAAIGLPPGQGTQFAQDMDALIEAARRAISRAFRTPEYRQRRDEIHQAMEQRREQLVQSAMEQARAQGFALSITPVGVAAVPLVEGRPITAEEYERLAEEPRRALREQSERLVAATVEVLDQVQSLEKEAHAQIAELDRQAALFALGPLVRERQANYREHAKILEHLNRVQDDIVARLDEFRREAEGGAEPTAGDEHREHLAEELEWLGRERVLERYRVNVLVDNRDLASAPAVFEPNPTYYNLVGRIEYHVRLGTMVTDFRMIKSGALHRANGGYLVVQALDLLASPFTWDALKRTLRTGQIRIETLGEQVSLVPTTTLRPEPIPVDVKVILIGPPFLYYLLYFVDEDFRKLFKIKADFDVEMARTPEHLAQYCAFVCRQVQEQRLRHFHRSAVARIAEHGARLAEHQGRLSTRFSQIADLAAEASHWAAKADSRYVLAEHVDRAIEQKTYRSNLIEEKIQQLIDEGTIFIDTTGARLGQVNGLSILDLGDYYFGRPVRITAQAAFGGEGVVNVEREARLSGRLHNKGFLILTSFLSARYAQDKPLALAARITFEQTYDEIEGDSASSTELYALLSCLADLPLRQDIAATGSVNQHGEIQPVGAATRKIEGFFDVCKAKGLTGRQGVILPEANGRHLMLREEVVEAVRAGQFHVWAVRTIDDGIELLTGVPAGQRQPDGTWEAGTVNDRVDRRLREYAEHLKSFARGLERPELAERPPAAIGPRTPRVLRWVHRLRQLTSFQSLGR
ncbi:MAG: AAA family ATPase [Chloroflexi bacterium]|nr:AAA family ATPase [Chloroflexota bacterium]